MPAPDPDDSEMPLVQAEAMLTRWAAGCEYFASTRATRRIATELYRLRAENKRLAACEDEVERLREERDAFKAAAEHHAEETRIVARQRDRLTYLLDQEPDDGH